MIHDLFSDSAGPVVVSVVSLCDRSFHRKYLCEPHTAVRKATAIQRGRPEEKAASVCACPIPYSA